MSDLAIRVQGLAKRFGRKRVLEEVTLDVPRGKTYAFLGRNGTGKTTTIRILMGLDKADGGTASVLGLSPGKDAMEIRRRVGYMAEDQTMFAWMRVSETLGFVGSFYATWDAALARELLRRFELPERTRVKALSKGQNCRLALLLALAHRPEVVILDDPTLGLDPIMRKEFLRDVVGYLQGGGTTVFFSSHLLYEVEPVADMVGILEGGRMIVQEDTDTLREKVKRLVLPAQDYEKIGGLPGTLDAAVRGTQAAVVVENAPEAERAAAQAGIPVHVDDLNLDEIFEAYVIGKGEPSRDRKADLERVA